MSNLQPGKGAGSGSGISKESSLRYPTNGKTVYHRPLNRTKTAELSQAAFAYLFSEMVTYASKQIVSIQDLEKRLNTQGHPIGLKLLDLLLFREPPRTQLRPLNIIALLHLIKQQVWTALFARAADGLEKSSDPAKPDEYMIIDNEPLVNAYVSVPRDMSQLSCAAFAAGVVEGVCDGAGFPARVTAHSVGKQQAAAPGPAEAGAGGAGAGAGGAADGTGEGAKEMWPGRTVFLVKFEPEVMEREGFLGKS